MMRMTGAVSPTSTLNSTSSTLNAAGEAFVSFLAYQVEKSGEGSMDDKGYRIRHFKINFFLQDGSLEMFEKREKNSGMSGGAFLKRHKTTIPFEAASFNIGSTVNLYGVQYTIYAMSSTARSYLEENGIEVPQDQQAPEDPYLAKRRPEDNAHTDAKIPGYKYDEFKRFAEGQLGFPSHLLQPGDSLRQFLQNDGKVLRFLAAWDNRTEMFGRIEYFLILFFLSDSTVQVIRTPGPESILPREEGVDRPLKEPMATLAKRGKLPKRYDGLHSLSKRDSRSEFLGPEDILPGKSVNVYGRELTVLHADDFTRRYMEERGYWQPGMDTDSLVQHFLSESHPPIKLTREMPPHNHFGSEEDSRGNVLRLVPKPPRRDIAKLLENDGKVLRYEIRMVPKNVDYDDEEPRMFVLSYYLSDDTIQVVEQRQRNSGRTGGTFLKRAKVPEVSSFKDIQVGSTIVLHSQAFAVVGMDEYSRRFLDAPDAADELTDDWNGRLIDDPVTLHEKVAEKILTAAKDLRSAFRLIDVEHDGLITVDEMEEFLKRFDFRITDRALVGVMRLFDGNRDGVVNYEEFVASLQPFITVSAKKPTLSSSEDLDEYRDILVSAEQGKSVQIIVNRILKAMSETVFVKRAHFTESVYKAFDTNRDGVIDVVEFNAALGRLGIKLEQRDRDAVVQYMFGGNTSKPLDYRQFLSRISYYQAALDSKNPLSVNVEMRSAFSTMSNVPEPLDPVFPGASPKRSTSRLSRF
jgi:Ca2+-binding EF-hand superfamily protein